MTTTFDSVDDEPMLYKVYDTYFVTADKLELKARILKWNPVEMIMINTQYGGLLTQLDSLLSARYITGTTRSVAGDFVEIEEDDGVRYTLNGCTVEMLAVLLEALALAKKDKEAKVKVEETEADDAEEDKEEDKADEAEDADVNDKDEDDNTDDDDDLEYNFYEELAELTTKALNLASHIVASLKLKLKLKLKF